MAKDIGRLTMHLTLDTSGFDAFCKHMIFSLWVLQHGEAYNRATCRVITAI